MTPNVAFLGIGRMGLGMATNIARAGFPLTVWNRTPGKSESLVTHHAVIAESAAEAVAEADIVCACVTDAAAVREILFDRGVAEAMKPGAIFCDLSSIAPQAEQEFDTELTRLGLRHIDAPVSGGTQGAELGSLAIMVGGEKDTFVEATPVLAAMGRPFRVGPCGAGQLTKLCNQVIVAISIAGLSESMLLAEAGGANPASVRDALRGGFAESRVLQEHGGRILERNWSPGAPVRNMLKDLDTVLTAAKDCGLELPFLSLARDFYNQLSTRGFAEHDQTALLLELERRNAPHRVGEKPDSGPDA
ncbi:NAD(P)-dependent oxidoreductase [Nisaea acidiphila]|uniref:NAD(P)-dependent oxidoreductase n=1 Tax=Nisaea acidiphila TaxID=1862145 RepID=A0A9J7ALA0_9PROT|nr:NAD(P)-dependent oxidoreductase [Nisaea acidiphila]UUX48256.1 NAD(P)-dependent oxidoreductase [Nisaea acidiphila]